MRCKALGLDTVLCLANIQIAEDVICPEHSIVSVPLVGQESNQFAVLLDIVSLNCSFDLEQKVVLEKTITAKIALHKHLEHFKEINRV